ncbi:hypothetical protein NMY22_g15237 [Coprinellus aureogranulatus]|nr:hypothetical protein NMY22_g15237 [Coprinellus aureogranulatus]
MHQCLWVSEVVRCIANDLDVPDALNLAKTCRALLDPCLDRVWWSISSFKPLIACLPKDALSETATHQDNGEETIMVSLTRDLTPIDLKRYMDYYACRIRQVDFTYPFGGTTLSIESLHGVQLATDCGPGSFSPLLKDFQWFDIDDVREAFGRDYALQLPPLMSLFLPLGVEKLYACCSGYDPLSLKAPIHSSIKQCESTLKEICISGTELIDHCLETCSWRILEKISLFNPNISSLPMLSKFPQITKMEISRPEVDKASSLESLAIPSQATPDTFPALRSLNLSSMNTHDIQRILSYLPRNHQLRLLAWHLPWSGATVEDCRRFVDILEMHPEYFHLNHLEVVSSQYASLITPEPLDMNPLQIDIRPLFKFTALQTLLIDVDHSIMVTPSLITAIPDVWPQLRRLILAPSRSISHPPTIDHTHILHLAQRLPQLTELGIRFDASCVTGQERIDGSFHKLRILRVGRSPICSTSGVIAFLRHNFPRLETLDIECRALPEDMTIFKRRWEAVLAGWKEAPSNVGWQTCSATRVGLLLVREPAPKRDGVLVARTDAKPELMVSLALIYTFYASLWSMYSEKTQITHPYWSISSRLTIPFGVIPACQHYTTWAESGIGASGFTVDSADTQHPASAHKPPRANESPEPLN